MLLQVHSTSSYSATVTSSFSLLRTITLLSCAPALPTRRMRRRLRGHFAYSLLGPFPEIQRFLIPELWIFLSGGPPPSCIGPRDLPEHRNETSGRSRFVAQSGRGRGCQTSFLPQYQLKARTTATRIHLQSRFSTFRRRRPIARGAPRTHGRHSRCQVVLGQNGQALGRSVIRGQQSPRTFPTLGRWP